MTLIVENGTGVTNANSYVSVSDHVAYCAAYGVTVTNSQAEINLRKFMDYIESLNGYKGCKTIKEQVLRFPRKNMYIDGVLIASNAIPWQLPKAQNEGALCIANGVDKLAVRTIPIKSEKFGPFETTYMDNRETVDTSMRTTLYLQPLLKNDISGIHFKVETDRERCNGYYDDESNSYYGGIDGYSYYE